MSRAKVLVVGGAGYVGGTLVDQLKGADFDVTVYDILAYEERYLKKDVKFVYGDVRDKEKLGKLLPNFDIVVWLAAVVGDGACAADPLLSEAINTDAVKWMVDNFKGRIIFPSTCSVYGMNNELIDEDAPPNPLSVYAKTKLAAERYILEHANDPLVFRLGTLYGLGDEHSRIRLDLVVNVLTKRAISGETLHVCGGQQWRPLIHVQDVASAMTFGAFYKLTGLYNLATKNCTIREIAEEIQKVIPNCQVSFTDGKFEDLRNYRVSTDRWRNSSGSDWYPHWLLEEGISQIAHVIKEQRIKNPEDPIYSNEAYIKGVYRRWP